MLPIAGQTAGPIGLKFIVDTRGWPVLKSKINSKFLLTFFLKTFLPRTTPSLSAPTFIN